MPISFHDPGAYSRLEAEDEERKEAERYLEIQRMNRHRQEAEKYEDQVVPARRNRSVDLDEEIQKYE